ncbi:MAG TPA: winged helix-turn-helix domain-containing protein [Candidatus Nanoarchaeia archaeon]|nr:winged helix-turn-helix domain-containing protein [Candidatus Nanoarchaeia archaeon]
MLNLTQRELIVKLSKQRKNQQEIADIIGCSQPTVNLWLQREKKGLSLKTLPRSGRPTPLTTKTLAKLKKEFEKEARDANKNFCSINTKQFFQMINQKTNKNYSPRHLRRILHKLNFSKITPRSQHIKNDPEKVEEFRQEFKKNFKQNTWIMRL